MSIHISGTGEKVAIFRHIKMLKVALSMATDEGRDKAVIDEIQAELDASQISMENAEGRLFMDASGNFEFMQMAAQHISSIEEKLGSN